MFISALRFVYLSIICYKKRAYKILEVIQQLQHLRKKFDEQREKSITFVIFATNPFALYLHLLIKTLSNIAFLILFKL